MGENKIDITSTLLESTVDGAKGFLGKLLGASVEEYGLMLADNVKLRRFKNQLNMVNKAQKIVEESGINIKQISIKQLVPLLEYSSLEEDESLQDKWANMLVNFIDRNKKLESSIFPFILSQLSSEEIEVIDVLYNTRNVSGLLLLRQNIDSVTKSNLIRLGIAQIVVETTISPKRSIREIRNSFGVNGKIKITSLGVLFYEICTNTNDIEINN